MATDLINGREGKVGEPAVPPRPEEPGLSSLIGGIVDDAQKLIEHQFSLLTHDIRKDVKRAKETGLYLGVSFALLSAGGLLMMLMLVHLLEWLARPSLELWACYAIVGVAVTVAGLAFFAYGKQKLEKLNVVPEQTAQGMKENLQWKTNPN